MWWLQLPFSTLSSPVDTPPTPALAKMRADLDVDEVCVFHDLEVKIIRVSCNCMVKGK